MCALPHLSGAVQSLRFTRQCPARGRRQMGTLRGPQAPKLPGSKVVAEPTGTCAHSRPRAADAPVHDAPSSSAFVVLSYPSSHVLQSLFAR